MPPNVIWLHCWCAAWMQAHSSMIMSALVRNAPALATGEMISNRSWMSSSICGSRPPELAAAVIAEQESGARLEVLACTSIDMWQVPDIIIYIHHPAKQHCILTSPIANHHVYLSVCISLDALAVRSLPFPALYRLPIVQHGQPRKCEFV